jgi:hypothetical protein
MPISTGKMRDGREYLHVQQVSNCWCQVNKQGKSLASQKTAVDILNAAILLLKLKCECFSWYKKKAGGFFSWKIPPVLLLMCVAKNATHVTFYFYYFCT